MLANTCAGCHGTDGASAGDVMPTIGGMDHGYLYLVLSEFKSGARDSTIMGRIAKGYEESELKAIASYLGAKPWVSAPGGVDSRLAQAGKKIHEDKCDTCHEDGGREQDDETPRIAGQWPQYTQVALEDCRAKGKRCPPKQMGNRVKDLSDEDLRALANFYAGQK